LDTWLPDYHVRTVQRRVSRASPQDLWRAAARTRIRDTRVLRPVIGARLGPHAPPAETTFRELFRTDIFTLLEEGDRYSISGVAAGRVGRLGEKCRHRSAPIERGDPMPEYAPGTPSWVELSSSDPDAAAAFYREVMGWQATEPGPVEETGGYRMFQQDGKNIG